MAEDGCDGGLPARAGHGDELASGQGLGERGGPVHDGDSGIPRLAQAGIRILNSGGHDDARRPGVHAAPVVGEERHSLRRKRAQHRRGRGRGGRDNLPIGAGHGASLVEKRLREGAHAHAADAD